MWERMWEEFSRSLMKLFQYLFLVFKNTAPKHSDSKDGKPQQNDTPPSAFFDDFEKEENKEKPILPKPSHHIEQDHHDATASAKHRFSL